MSPIDRRQLPRLSTDAAARLRAVAARTGRVTQGEEVDTPAKPSKAPKTDYLAVKAALQERLLDEIGERGLLESEGADVATAVRKIKNFKGVTGSIEFDSKGDPVKAKYFVLQFEKQAYPGKVVKVIEQQAPAAVAKKS